MMTAKWIRSIRLQVNAGRIWLVFVQAIQRCRRACQRRPDVHSEQHVLQLVDRRVDRLLGPSRPRHGQPADAERRQRVHFGDNHQTVSVTGQISLRLPSSLIIVNISTSSGREAFGMDLVSLNIQRSRDHGIAGYNSYRELCGLKRAAKFEDFSPEIDPAV